MKESIGILGAGSIGLTLARHFVNNGYEVIISNRQGPETLADIVQEIGAGLSAGTPQLAAAADIIIIAIPWSQISTLARLTNWKDKVVIDATNAFSNDFRPVNLGDMRSSEIIAGYLTGANVVKAFNTLYYKILAQDPVTGGGNRVIFYAGDDAAAKDQVSQLIRAIGFAGVDTGNLFDSRIMEPNQPLSGLNLLQVR